MRARSVLMLAMVAIFTHLAGPSDAAAGARTPMGQIMDDPRLSQLGNANVGVVVFFRPDQRNMDATLQSLAGCQKELADKPLSWLALVPARFSLDEAKAVAQAAGLKGPVLVDADDSLSNLFGVAMHPTVAILDKQHKLVGFQPYTRLNFCESVMARLRHALGELDDAGLARALDPSADMPSGETSAAKRDVKLAGMLLKSGNLDKALEIARTGATKDPKNAAAQSMIGRILAAKGDCAAASAAFDASLKLDANDADAQAGKKSCAGK
ncbi:MAG TPA: tetratricopeptide repeat protein [Myxococcales bacterium]|nr:tetratricopeptide repeat protein [Myxococcales bacterium]